MQEALTILQAFGHDFGVSAEIVHIIRLIRQYERLTGEVSGMGIVLHWLEAAASDFVNLSNTFPTSSQTSEDLQNSAMRILSYVSQLRAVGIVPTDPN
jgi:hypothetical protein